MKNDFEWIVSDENLCADDEAEFVVYLRRHGFINYILMPHHRLIKLYREWLAETIRQSKLRIAREKKT